MNNWMVIPITAATQNSSSVALLCDVSAKMMATQQKNHCLADCILSAKLKCMDIQQPRAI